MKSLDKVFKIIELLRENSELGLKELSEKLDMNKSTTYRMLASLARHNYVEKNYETKKYKLSIKFVEIGNQVIQNLDIINISKKYIDELNSVTKETIHLAVLSKDKVMYVDKRESQRPIRLFSQIGRITPWHCTGVGKVILAFQSEEFINNIIETIDFYKYTDNTITNKEDLLAELWKIKEQGYATDREEHSKNVGCIAAPVFDHSARVIASLSVTFIFDIENLNEQLLEYKDLILKNSMMISQKLGYRDLILK
jgi:IclR family transcriptional regulator, KDG regulon repressor